MRWMWEVATRAYRRQSTYRGATFAGVFTNTVFGFILAYVLLAVYQERSEDRRLHLGRCRHVHVRDAGDADGDRRLRHHGLADRIRTGDVVSDLYRPVDFQAYWLADSYGRASSTRSSAASPRSSWARSCSTCACRARRVVARLLRVGRRSQWPSPSGGASSCSSPPSGCSTSAVPTSSAG